MSRIKISNEHFYLVIVFLVAVIAILPIAFFGIPDSNDLPQHFKFAQTYYNSLTTGNFFPNWADKENFGYGDVGIRFYPPLAYYFLAFARILIGNWYDAAWLTFAFWLILGCFGVYFWARCWLSVKHSAIAAVFYTIVPYHLSQLYMAFNYSQFVGACVLPFCFAFLTRVFWRGKLSDVLGLAVAYATLLISHLPLSIIGSLSLLVYAATLLRKENLVKSLAKAVAAVALGLGASSFYWIGVVTEMKWLRHTSERYNSAYYGFENNFFPSFLQTHENFPLYNALLSDTSVILNGIFLFSAIFYFVYRKHKPIDQPKNIFQTVLPVGLLACFMVTILSRPIWEILTPIQKVQFPARWMAVVAMCGAVVAAASFDYLLKGDFLKKRICTYGCLIALVTVLLFDFIYIFHPVSFAPIPREKFETQIQKLPEEESFDCWWAIWSQGKAFKVKEKVLAENRETEITDWQAEQRNFTVAEGIATKARIATFYYPHWQATVNDVVVEVEKDENGVILIPIPAEKSTVRVYFQEPLRIKIASAISFLTWTFFGGCALFLFYKKFCIQTFYLKAVSKTAR